MAKVQPSDLFTSLSGKLCSKEGTYISLNKQTGKMFSAVRHNNTNPNTEKQQAVRKTFVSQAKFAAAWWKANRPSTSQPRGSDSYQLVMKAYKAQRKIGNPYNYLRSLVTDDMKVKLGDLDITGSVTPSAGPSAGGAGVKPGTSGSGTQGSGTTDGDGGDA